MIRGHGLYVAFGQALPEGFHIFVAAQGSDNVVILDGESGAVIADTPVGAGTRTQKDAPMPSITTAGCP